MSITFNIANEQLPSSQQNTARQEELQQQNNAATKMQALRRGKVAQQEFQQQKNAATKIQSAQRGKVARQEFLQQKQKEENKKTYNTIFERIRQESEEEKKKQKESYKEYRKQEFLNDFKISENLKYKAFDDLDMSVFENPETFNEKISERIKNIGKIIKSKAVEKKQANINQTIEIDVKKMLDIIGIKIPQDEKVVFEIKSQELKTNIVRIVTNTAATKIQALRRGNVARQELQQRQQQNTAATKIQAVQRGKVAREELQQQNTAATKIQAVERGRIVRGQFGVRRQEFQQRQQQKDAATKIQRAQRARSQAHLNTIDVNLFKGGKTTRKKKSKKNKTRKKK